MDHDSYKERLSALLDGELNETERGAALTHLAACEECRAYFAELNAMRDALGGLDEVDPPADFAAGVLARLHAESAPRKAKRRGAWRGWTALAACAAVIVLAVSTLPRMGKSTAPALESAAPAAHSAAPSAAGESYGFMAETADDSAAEAPSEMESLLMTSALETPRAEEPAAPAAVPAESPVPKEFLPATDGALPEAELTLMGEGAAEWLEANAEPLGNGLWRVSVEAANELPDTLSLVAVDGLQEPADGTLIITFGTPENPR